jgi:glycosyltransferase involved in cell wall biosynthesis
LRGLYTYLPFARSTYANATAIIAGSSHTYNEFARYADKLFFVPGENGLLASTISSAAKPRRGNDLELIFVGRLIPLKACDIAIRSAAPFLRDGTARMKVLGNGPERAPLERLVRSLGIQERVNFFGRLPHLEALNHIREADVMVFPSLREFGGAVVFEALALGTVPVVADFGGPGDIVDTRIGYKVPLVDEETMVAKFQAVLNHLASDREHLAALQQEAVTYARDYLTWDAKARMVTDVLCWAVGDGPKPDLRPPQRSTAPCQ